MSALVFDESICQDPAESFHREWLETNGLGGFASATISGANTRRYHGLLVAATEPPTVRCVLLSRLEETLIIGPQPHQQRYELSTNFYPGVTHPEGYRSLIQFRLDPFPVFTFRAGGVTIEKRVFMVQDENTVVVEYQLIDGPACELELRPLTAFRGYHDLTHSNTALNSALDESAGVFSIQPYAELPRLFFAHNARALARGGSWYFNFEYPMEQVRGLDYREDLFCPCMLSFDLQAHGTAVVIATTATHAAGDSVSLKENEIRRRTPLDQDILTSAAGQFVVQRGPMRTIIAGYPWFTDWGRDTMIALPGLTLATGRFDVARDILLAFSGIIDRGMLPNCFPDAGGAPEYNTADATLWFFEAVRQYLEYSGDVEFVRTRLYEKLKEIIAAHLQGTRFGIHMDADGLLAAGNPSTNLTWMDARVNGAPVTPRNGKPVEIQALWYNALRFLARLAKDFDEDDAQFEGLATKAAASFSTSFWNEDAGCLYDVVDGSLRDASLRPNQVIALSLGNCAIPNEKARRIIATVERSLLTPYGLRTLAPSDPRYRGRYEGSAAERDAAYHQGTVWPWLLGPFITADRRFNGDRAAQLLGPLREFALSRGVGQLPEIFDGDAPHNPRGCYAQAWSVGEILRM
ncbi:MAG TPA: amylo-alpha-1,6-glucosidase [Bryobacteraceae bacterium]|nr:amylo-alpha-1,6-glucosidase [Bryobacteraceae bacterium]